MCSRSPRREASAFTPTLPLWVTIATAPGSTPAATSSPHSGARAQSAATPFPFGPQTGSSCRSAAARRSACSATPPGTSAKPAEITIAPPQPRSPAASSTPGTEGAGIATTTASTGSGRSATVGTHVRPMTSARRGLTPHTGPAKPERARLPSTISP